MYLIAFSYSNYHLADTLREAAFEYKNLKRFESEVSSYKDDLRLPCDIALKKTVVLSEK